MSTQHWGTTVEEPTIDQVYETLAHDERRAILDMLASGDGELDLEGLVERARTWNGVSRQDEQRYTVRLVHQHLPKMTEAGLVVYDRDAGHVSITDAGVRANLVRRHATDVFREK